MERREPSTLEKHDEDTRDVDRLIHWAEADTTEHEIEGDACEADMMEDSVGLPSGTTGRLEEHLLEEEDAVDLAA